MRKLTAFVCLMTLFLAAGCSTMEGFGKDLQKLGGNIEQKAKNQES